MGSKPKRGCEQHVFVHTCVSDVGFERERERESESARERERERESARASESSRCSSTPAFRVQDVGSSV